MDPVSLIVAALTAGVSKAAGEMAVDAYHALLGMLRRHFGRDEMAAKVLEEHVKDMTAHTGPGGTPSPWDAPLRMYLEQLGVAADAEVVGAAQTVLTRAGRGGPTSTSYRAIAGPVNVASGAHVYAGGDIASARIEKVG